MIFPDHIGKLMAAIEAGEPVTQADVDRIATLQALSIAKAGQDFAKDMIDEHEKALAFLEGVT